MKYFFATILLFGSLSVHAAVPASGQKISTNASEIVQQQTALHAQVLSGKGAFKDMDPSARNDLLKNQEIVFDLLKDKKSTTELSQTDQVRVSNAISSIIATVSNAEDERMVCRREKPAGSNIPGTICKTVAQRRAEREQAVDARSRSSAKCITDCSGQAMRPEGW